MTDYNAKAIILGCGASGGVPRIDGHFGICNPDNPKNYRTRCSLYFTYNKKHFLIDTSPDMRTQFLREKIYALDTVFFTHDHADQTHGVDDVRAMTFIRKKPIDAYADIQTAKSLKKRFEYIFYAKENSIHPPILHLTDFKDLFYCREMEKEIYTFPCPHGGIAAKGYVIGDIAYSPDVHDLSKETLCFLKEKKLSYWVVDCLRDKPHGTHAHYERVMGWLDYVKPQKMILTNLLFDFDYDLLSKRVPSNVIVAYDGLDFSFMI